MHFKVLEDNGLTTFGRSGWHLPNGEPGKWMPRIEGELIACKNGYHLCRSDDLIQWLGPVIYEAEARGEVVDANDKIVVREARLVRRLDGWNDRTARLFAAECAEHVLHIFEKECPGDTRPCEAIEMARKVANGELPESSLAAARAAARDAACDAAGAAEAAAGAAAWAAGAAARAAAEDAAWAAGAAACDAARDAAWDAERGWQTARLMEILGIKAA